MTGFWNDFPSIKNGLEAVANVMSKTVRAGGFPLGNELARVVDADGKMLRPGFMLLSSEFGKAKKGKLIPLAAAVELLHLGTLLHDDILDDASLRRGEAAFHTKNGVKNALLTGDWLFAQCFRLAADFSNPANARNLGAVVGIICSSEIRQDLDKFRYSRSVREYLRKIGGKTAALFSLAFHVGASESGCSPGTVDTLRRAGYNIGMAFQVIDDILDVESTEGVFRKPVGKDLSEGLCTLPLIHALNKDDGRIGSLLASPPFLPETIDTIMTRIRDTGALDDSRTTARLYTERALKEIDRLPDRSARRTLRQVTERLLVREY